jgi:hypothetical protein
LIVPKLSFALLARCPFCFAIVFSYLTGPHG